MVCSFPPSPEDDDQYRYQENQQVAKIEFECRVQPPKANELINQDRPLFIGKFLGRESSYEHDKIGNYVQYAEKHLEPPLI
jgi:hypothetical protein